MRKTSSAKRVYIVGDSIVKHVNGYDISRKTENSKVFARPSYSATVRCMTDHVKPVLTDNPDYIVFRIGTNDVLSNKTPEYANRF